MGCIHVFSCSISFLKKTLWIMALFSFHFKGLIIIGVIKYI